MRAPIFLLGMPRSGTTWVAKVFDSHPDVSYRHEGDTEFDLHLELPLYPELDEAEEFAPVLKRFVEDKLARHCSVRTCGKRPLFPKTGDHALSSPIRELRMNVSRVMERVIGKPSVWRTKLGDRRLVWKSVESPARLGLFLKVYPEARGIFILRDPCGYVASVLRGEKKMKFSGSQSMAENETVFRRILETPYAQSKGITLEDVFMMGKEARLGLFWALLNQKTAEDLKQLKNGKIIRYEDLCRNPMGNYKQLFEYCGLNWNPQTDAFVASSISSEDESYYSVFKDPEKAAYKWKEELYPSQIEAIHEAAREHAIGRAYLGEGETDLDDLFFKPV
ncbi:MAG: sulfotransferase family protein [Gammaproteobacteria bacterium]